MEKYFIQGNLSNKKLKAKNAVTLGYTINLNRKTTGPTNNEKKLAEKALLRRIYNGIRILRECKVDDSRAKFLIVFSPDGTKLACTNANHHIYIIDVITKKVLRTLSGHRRTPWTIAFHPTNNNTLASGCLNGEVRIWNLEDGSFEVWHSPGQTVIASVAFHPKVKLLVIATYRDLYFWDWKTSIIFGHRSTKNEYEKIRYVKFDSTGDKLITAVALRTTLLSQYDSISYREAHQCVKERDILKDFRLVEKFCETHISSLKESNINNSEIEPNITEATFKHELPPSISNQYHSRLDIVSETMPYMCIYHRDVIHSALNVAHFCPFDFSISIINILKKNTSSKEYFSEKCYFCRYAWLYRTVFEIKFVNDSRSTCDEDSNSFFNNEEGMWKFSETRKEELIAENQDTINGLTEETLRYCFEQFARIRIAPYFANIIANGVCSKCTIPFTEEIQHFMNKDGPKGKKPVSHNVSMRSNYFLNSCEIFRFRPSGSFTPFITAFTEMYQFLPVLQRISPEENGDILNTMMTECEYLYCKLLLINNIVEGDELIVKKKFLNSIAEDFKLNMKKERHDVSNILYPNREQVRKRFKLCSSNQFLTMAEDSVSTNKVESICQCRRFDEGSEKSVSVALKTLKKELENLSNSVKKRYNSEVQRCRIEKSYEHEVDWEIHKTGASVFRIFQITKMCLRIHLSAFLTELKKLIKINFQQLGTNDVQFNLVFIRLFMFIIRRSVLLTNNLLEFLCNFKYDMKHLLETSPTKVSYKPTVIPSLQHRPYRFLDNILPYPRSNYHLIDSEHEPVFDEEHIPVTSELADDELSSYACDTSSFADPALLSVRLSRRRKLAASDIYLRRYLEYFDPISECYLDRDNPVSYQKFLLENVNRLFCHFQSQTLEQTAAQRTHDQLQAWDFSISEIEQTNNPHKHHPLHRLQMWNFSALEIPDISSSIQNTIVTECKVHNDATVAISNDDSRVAVLLSRSQFDQPDRLGVFSIEWKTLGHILCVVSLSQTAVSVGFLLPMSTWR